MATIQKTTLKRFNGTDWDPVHLATSGDITQAGESWQIMGQSIGAYNVGDTVNASDMITDILKKMTQTRIAATYTAPTLGFTAAQGSTGTGSLYAAGNYEAGSNINAKLTATATQNDAGELTNLKINNGSADVVTGTTNPAVYEYAGQLGDNVVTFTATYAYADGAVKNDNLGDPSPTGQIKAGSKTATIKYTPFRKYFYGADSAGEQTAIADSADIRALTASTGGASKGTKFSIPVPVGSTRCTIAFKSTVGTLAQVLYRESGNANITGQFQLSKVNVEGANGYTATEYNVYTISWAQPTAGAMTFDVTI